MDPLTTEAVTFGRYLLGRMPPPELVVRYGDASRTIFPDPPDAADGAILGFMHRHPWSVPYLDAILGFVRPGSVPRNKVLLMAAVLEASPASADEFLPRSVPLPRLLFDVIVSGTRAVVRAAIGLCLYPIAARSRA